MERSVFTNELRKTAGMNCLYYELHLYCRENLKNGRFWIIGLKEKILNSRY